MEVYQTSEEVDKIDCLSTIISNEKTKEERQGGRGGSCLDIKSDSTAISICIAKGRFACHRKELSKLKKDIKKNRYNLVKFRL